MKRKRSSPPERPAATPPAATVVPAPPIPDRRSWEAVLLAGWRPAALIALAAVSVVFIIWSAGHRELLFDYILRPENNEIRNSQQGARKALLRLLAAGLIPAAVAIAFWTRRARRGLPPPNLDLLLPVVTAIGIPFLTLPTVEYEHPYLTAAVILGFGVALARVVRGLVLRHPGTWRDLTPRHALYAVLAGCLVFVGVMGFLAHWRFITFQAEPYDTSWETNAVWGIVHHGIPTTSVGAESYYQTKALPVTYFDLHAPFAYYLYAPFFAIWQDARTLLWLQAVWMASGAFGVYLAGRAWLRTRWAGVALAWIYLLNPMIQNYCLHDIHANVLAVPTLLLALGLMESGRVRLAVAAAIATALCREETGLYAACLGLFWTFGGGGGHPRGRVRAGLITTAAGLAILVLIAGVLMPAFGGQPRWGHFSFFFGEPGMASEAEAFLLNPMGALVAAGETWRSEFFFVAFLPLGLLAIFGWRGGWFLLLTAALMLGASNPSFYAPGTNYSAPTMPAALIMSFLGIRAWLITRRNRTRVELGANRAAIVSYALIVAVMANGLYGNIFSKSYKLEYGESPFRRQGQFDYRDHIGYVSELPPFGARERDLWQVIRHVPRNAPVATSWSINPQLSNRAIAILLPYLGEANPPRSRPTYVVIDKLPPMIEAPERHIERFRNDPEWMVHYENAHGVVFRRR